MAGRRARGHEDLRHSEHGFRGGQTAGEDLRVSKHDGSGIRPGVLQMLYGGGSVAKPSWQPGLFKGGPAKQVATDDLRHGRHESVKPATGKMLFKGGPARQVDGEDYRVGHGTESQVKPGEGQMLAGGGEAGFSDSEKLAAHEAMAAFKSGDAQKLLKAMKGLFYLFESEGQDEGPAEDGEEG